LKIFCKKKVGQKLILVTLDRLLIRLRLLNTSGSGQKTVRIRNTGFNTNKNTEAGGEAVAEDEGCSEEQFLKYVRKQQQQQTRNTVLAIKKKNFI
jgi:hypothetical protein